jgi:predicted phosphodiesterase
VVLRVLQSATEVPSIEVFVAHAFPIRILSDLHIGHPLSRIRKVAQLRPLFEGAGTVVLNGDSVEPFLKPDREAARQKLNELTRLIRACGAEPVVLSGNHDPEESPLAHLDLLDGLVHVTHGDVLFEEIAPWATDSDRLEELRHEAMAERTDAIRSSVEAHLAAMRTAVQRFHAECQDPRRTSWFVPMVRRALWLPLKVIKARRAWRQSPELGRRYLRQFRPQTRFLIMGHTHRPGVARAGRRIIINTGSFQYGLGAYVVDVSDQGVTVRSVGIRGGAHVAGDLVSAHPAEPLT